MGDDIHSDIGVLREQVSRLNLDAKDALDEASRLKYRNSLLERRIEDIESGRVKPDWLRNAGGQNLSQCQIDNAASELIRIYNSKSWRVTAPLRAMLRCIKAL